MPLNSFLDQAIKNTSLLSSQSYDKNHKNYLAAWHKQKISNPQNTPKYIKQTTKKQTPYIIASQTHDRSLHNLIAGYQLTLSRLQSTHQSHQIATIADIIKNAFGLEVEQNTVDALNLGSINGWLAYMLYDDFIDNDRPLERYMLSVANYALRLAYKYFRQALPENLLFQNRLDSWLNITDEANAWEQLNAQAKSLPGQKFYLKSLPNYGDLSHLAWRSYGHILAPIGILEAAGATNKIADVTQYFHHYLICRQLSDDLKDWQQDMQRGRVTIVIQKLLTARRKSAWPIIYSANPGKLSREMTPEIIIELAMLGIKHCQLATKFITSAKPIHPEPLIMPVDEQLSFYKNLISSVKQQNKFFKYF